MIMQADRGENQREKSKVSPLPVSPYYTTPDYTQGHYLVHTHPALHGPLTNPGCMYTSYFTSTVTLEVKVEQSSYLRAEQSSEMGAEQSPDSKSRAKWSSNLEVEWNLEQQKCEMGCPLTLTASLNQVFSFCVSCAMHMTSMGLVSCFIDFLPWHIHRISLASSCCL